MAKPISKSEAVEQAKAYGIDFSKDVFQISISDKSYLSELATKAGYRKSKSTGLSTGGAFFVHLQKFL